MFSNQLTEQHVHWREQGTHVLNCQDAGFERTAQDNEQAARDEGNVAIAWATDMSRAEMLARMDALEQRAEQS